MSGNRRRRLEKLEQKLADLIRQEALVNCICLERVFVRSSEKERFLSEMNKTCPVHGFRRLGVITTVWIGPVKKVLSPDELGLEEALQEYERRLAQAKEAEDEQEYD
jgi:hypothetical protein